MNITLSDILSTIKFNQGYIPTHELAMMLGIRHSVLLRKMKRHGVCLSDLETRYIDVPLPNGGTKRSKTYLLNDEEAVPLVMVLDMKLGRAIWDAFMVNLEVVDMINAGVKKQ